MKPEDKKLIYEYIEECTDTEENIDKYYANMDANLMVLAINKMREKGDWKKFLEKSKKEFSKTTPQQAVCKYCEYLFVWLFGNPTNFFNLMSEWLKGGIR